jgi:hypothetical protein
MGRRAGGGLNAGTGGGFRRSADDARLVTRLVETSSFPNVSSVPDASSSGLGFRETAETARGVAAAVAAARAAGEDVDAAARRAGGEIVYETVPFVIRFLEMFPWACQKMYPALFVYAAMFFAIPAARCAHATYANSRIDARNKKRRAAAERALRELIRAGKSKREITEAKRQTPTLV